MRDVTEAHITVTSGSRVKRALDDVCSERVSKHPCILIRHLY